MKHLSCINRLVSCYFFFFFVRSYEGEVTFRCAKKQTQVISADQEQCKQGLVKYIWQFLNVITFL